VSCRANDHRRKTGKNCSGTLAAIASTMAERAPHFLRFTQAIAFVSGLGFPAAVLLTPLAGCGGEPPDEGSRFCDCPAFTEGGVDSSATFPDGAAGVLTYDGGAHDGTALGVTIDAGIQSAPDSGDANDEDAPIADADVDAGGGPFSPPDLPA
jgi:hypothetical protein